MQDKKDTRPQPQTEEIHPEEFEKIVHNEFDMKTRVISGIVLVLVLITIWYMLDLVLLTFLITFIFYHLSRLTKNQLSRVLPLRVPDGLILSILYLIALFVLTVVGIDYAPKLIVQLTEISNIFLNFDINAVRDALDPRLADVLWHIDLNPYISDIGKWMGSIVTKAGAFGVNFLLAVLLSYLLLLEKPKIKKFGMVMENSRISFIYEYFMNFGGNFCKTFAKVMKVQVTIAFINCILSMIMLTALSFPQIMGLGIMIFCLGLIPVAGVIISLVPLTIIAFNLGGISKVLAVLVMVVVLHAFEAYLLNPKLMSSKTSLPVSFVFIILLVAEHYLHVWGLLIGVPLVIFLLTIFEVDYQKAATPHQNSFARFRKKKQEKGAAQQKP